MLGMRLPWRKECPSAGAWAGEWLQRLRGVTTRSDLRELHDLRTLCRFLEPCLQALLRVSLTRRVATMPLTVINALFVKFALITGRHPQLTRAAHQGFIWSGARPDTLYSARSMIYAVGFTHTDGCYIGQASRGLPARWPRHARALASHGKIDDLIHLRWYKTLGRRFQAGETPWAVPICEVLGGTELSTQLARNQLERNAIRCLGKQAWNSMHRVRNVCQSQQHLGMFRWMLRDGPMVPHRCYRTTAGRIHMCTTIPALALARVAGIGGRVWAEQLPSAAWAGGLCDPASQRQWRFEAEMLRHCDACTGTFNPSPSLAYSCGALGMDLGNRTWLHWGSASIVAADCRSWQASWRKTLFASSLRAQLSLIRARQTITLHLTLPVPPRCLPRGLSNRLTDLLRKHRQCASPPNSAPLGGSRIVRPPPAAPRAREVSISARARLWDLGELLQEIAAETPHRGGVPPSPLVVIDYTRAEASLKNLLDDGRKMQRRFALGSWVQRGTCPCLAAASSMSDVLGPNRCTGGKHFAGPLLPCLDLVPPNVRRPVGCRRAAESAFRSCRAHGLDAAISTQLAELIEEEVSAHVDRTLLRQYGQLRRIRDRLPSPLKLTVFDKKGDQWGVACGRLIREVYTKHFADPKYYKRSSAHRGSEASTFYGFQNGPPRPYVILKWKDVTRGRPIVSYCQAERKGPLRTISKILDRLLREYGASPDVWSVPHALEKLRETDDRNCCPFTHTLIGASDVAGMFTNIDRAECLQALRVFLDEHWKRCPTGDPKKVKLKRRTIIWVEHEAKQSRGAWSSAQIVSVVSRALALACFACGPQVIAQQNGLPLGHHLSAILSRLTVAYFEVRRVPALTRMCACGREHPLTIARWQDDTVYVQSVPRTMDVECWKRELSAIYPPSLTLEWNPGTGAGAEGASVVWTDLQVTLDSGNLSISPKEAWAKSAEDFRSVVPQRSLRWLWKSSTSIPRNYFIRLIDAGCSRDWKVWEVRAVLLLLAGYDVRDVVSGALRALWRRGRPRAAGELFKQWDAGGVLRDWVAGIRAARAGPNDVAMVNRAIAHRDARIPWRERVSWARAFSVGLIQPELDQGALLLEPRCAAPGKRVRFAL
eukprot:gene1370-biopygen2226